VRKVRKFFLTFDFSGLACEKLQTSKEPTEKRVMDSISIIQYLCIARRHINSIDNIRCTSDNHCSACVRMSWVGEDRNEGRTPLRLESKRQPGRQDDSRRLERAKPDR